MKTPESFQTFLLGTRMSHSTVSFPALKTALSRFAIAGLIALPAVSVLAQPASSPTTVESTTGVQAGPTNPGSRMHGNHHSERHDPAQMRARMAERQAQLKSKLGLTADQEPAWSAFTSAMQPPVRPQPDMKNSRAEMQKLPTPARIDRVRAERSQHMAQMSKAMDERGEATKRFYSVLTPEQKKIFDIESVRAGHGGPGSHEGRMHRG
jgi:periplasmic protein CpxP/Spy